jgi:hypothetical protein
LRDLAQMICKHPTFPPPFFLFFSKKIPPYSLAGFDLTTLNSKSKVDRPLDHAAGFKMLFGLPVLNALCA